MSRPLAALSARVTAEGQKYEVQPLCGPLMLVLLLVHQPTSKVITHRADVKPSVKNDEKCPLQLVCDFNTAFFPSLIFCHNFPISGELHCRSRPYSGSLVVILPTRCVIHLEW